MELDLKDPRVIGMLGMLPLLLLWLAGAVLCVVGRRRRPLFRLLLGTGLSILILTHVAFPFVIDSVVGWVSGWESVGRLSTQGYQLVHALVLSVSMSLGWALLLGALLWTRPPHDETRRER